MSEENVEIVFEALRRFEAEDFEWMRSSWHPDARLTGPEGWPEPGPFDGRGAIEKQTRRLASDMAEHRFKDVKVVAEGQDWVVVSFIWDVRGAGSGAPIASKMAGAYQLCGGLIKQAHFRWTADEALEAARLSE